MLFRSNYTQYVTHAAQVSAALPCTTRVTYTRKQLLGIRSVPLDPGLVSHLRNLGIGYHLASRRSTRGGKNRRRKIPVVKLSNRHCFDRHLGTADLPEVTFQPRSRVNFDNLIPVPLLTSTNTSIFTSDSNFRLCSFNAQSLGSTQQEKRIAVSEFLKDWSIDVMMLQETWFTEKGCEAMIADLAPSGYTVKSFPRSSRGGGVAMIFKNSLSDHIGISNDFQFSHKSFEICLLTLEINNQNFNFFNIYRTCPSSKNKLTAAMFFTEFSEMMEFINTLKGQTLILGDMNFHYDNLTHPHTIQAIDLLDTFCFTQLVKETTHQKGHILDWVMVRPEEDLVKSVLVSQELSSDHFSIVCDLNIEQPPITKKFRETRNISSVDKAALRRDFQADISPVSCPTAEALDSALVAVLDRHAPLAQKGIQTHKNDPWLPLVKDDLKNAKQKRRQAERKWLKSGRLTVFKDIYNQAKRFVTSLVRKARISYYCQKISESNSSKQLFSITNTLMGKTQSSPLPTSIPLTSLPDAFCDFFLSKVSKIRAELDNLLVTSSDFESQSFVCDSVFESFRVVTEDEVRRTILSSKPTTCPLDAIPTPLLIECLDELLPAITNIINDSLVSGSFPSIFKSAVVRPLLKKSNLDRNNLKNYRPVSNLSFLSKILEKIVLAQIFQHVNNNDLLPHNQSAYRAHHSTESALLKVCNDILLSLDQGNITVLTLLDLSAAFDTVDHDILFNTLLSHFGISGSALSWFKSYLTNRSQTVIIENQKSKSQNLQFGVPQGSVLGPILFLMYTKPLLKSIDQQNIQNQSFADDTQLYRSSAPSEVSLSINNIQTCIQGVRGWMTDNRLKLNDDKTEAILFHTKNSFNSSPKPDSIQVGSTSIPFSPSARNLGFIITEDMSLDAHITQTCRTAYTAIRQISTIRHYLSVSATKTLVCAFVLSRLDYCNSLLSGCPQYIIKKLDRVQNSAARLVMQARKHDHITPILRTLHWLPVHARIEYKIAVLCHNFFCDSSPHYLSSCLSVYVPRRSLRSSGDSRILATPRFRTKLGHRSFSCSAPEIWNALPHSIRHISSPNSFKTALKTHLFRKYLE